MPVTIKKKPTAAADQPAFSFSNSQEAAKV